MDRIVDAVMLNMDYFVLIFLRISALIFSSPIFGRKALPNGLKIMLCMTLAYVIFAADPNPKVIAYGNVIEYVVMCVKELLFGLVLGYVTTLMFSIPQTAGHVIDMQMGFGMVNVFDVQSNISVPVTGNFLYVAMMLSFFAVDGHHQLIYILQNTFSYIPVGEVALNPALGVSALEVFVLAFTLAAKVAMPMIAAGLMGEIIMGIVVRTTPQMNVFVVGIPLKIIMGFVALLLLLPVYVNFTNTVFDNMFESIHYMLGGLAAPA
ncbi:MAG TPA: flagellar biosynthetic protein FliR [Feifaniaceae bacterium]|nr:flagellar biosynthetic protein FliR [Feifaniaceae bacterium]